MELSVFWRLILSHLGILVLSGAACVYSIVQLGSLSGAARSTLDNDQRTIAYQEALTDAFLSEVRYGGKYLITHVEARHQQLLQFKKDFTDYLSRLQAMTEAGPAQDSLSKIDYLHRMYHELLDREITYIRAKQSYGQSRYQQERDKIVDVTLGELDILKGQLREKLRDKLENIDAGARRARRIALITAIAVLILGTFLSLQVSLTIAEPRLSHAGMVPWFRAALRWSGGIVSKSTHGRLQGKRLAAAALGLAAAWTRRPRF
jgi:CHASE3 domain sensor protein